MKTVTDSSIIVALLTARSTDELLRKRLMRGELHAPALIDAEVLNAIRGLLIGGKITLVRATRMLERFAALRIIRHPAIPHVRRVLELASNLTAYDALYVTLAERLRVPLLTRDAKYARAPVHKADIHLYPG
jgi:predicted nucleic acid-binding protein